MYKIYINETPLILCQSKDLYQVGRGLNNVLVNVYSGKTKHFLQVVDMLEKTDRWEAVILHDEESKPMWKAFKSLFQIIRAAGGVVENPTGEILMIHRLGYWDLPKGKIEKGEKKKFAAVREVIEETGISQVSLGKSIGKTYHTYRLKNGVRILKRTFWYAMLAPSQQLTPQTEEDISLAEWKRWDQEKDGLIPIYKNILDVLSTYFSA